MSKDAYIVERGSPGYPGRLEALGAAAPPELHLIGRLPDGPTVAIVGARGASAGALVTSRAVAAGAAAAGRAVVSGGAIGVDGAAHRGALDGGGRTVVVLGTGVDVAYPKRHKPLFEEAVAAGGALVSQFPPGTPPATWTFPKRNQLIAALADVTVVIEAGRGSGSLHTARAAASLGRPLLVVPGSPGCDRLIAQGAVAATDAAAVLEALASEQRQPGSLHRGLAEAPATARLPEPPAEPPADPRQRLLWNALDGTPRDVGELAARAGVPPAEANALAIDLEVGGFASRIAGGRYLRMGRM